ncbi:MAG: regulatory protein RecX [Gemmatimonadetes bacterium]|nr:MAG: regulatory protein RecX [Gemmatimonadota bacterium]
MPKRVKTRRDNLPPHEFKIRCKEYLLYLLSRRAYSRKELHQRAIRKGYPAEIIHEILDDLERVNLVNDTQFAEQWVASRLRSKPRGAKLLRLELKQKGIAPDIIDTVLADQFNDENPEKIFAQRVTQNYLKKVKHLDPHIQKRRIYQFLSRRGFSYDAISSVLDDLSIHNPLTPDNP